MSTVTFLSCAAVGLICFFVGVWSVHSKKDGTIKVNTSDPDKDVYSLILDIPLEEVPKRSRIHLNVEVS